jgi:hypothetical protein
VQQQQQQRQQPQQQPQGRAQQQLLKLQAFTIKTKSQAEKIRVV